MEIRQVEQTPEERAARIERLKRKGLYIKDLKQVPAMMIRRHLIRGMANGDLTDEERDLALYLGIGR